MGIQPIDLQTLYAQLDKVGKLQGNMRHLFASELEKGLQANKDDAARRKSTVQKIESGKAENIAVHKDGGGQSGFSADTFSKQKKESGEAEQNEDTARYIRDPHLGNKIDISG